MDWQSGLIEKTLHIDGGGQTLASSGELKGQVIDVRQWQSFYLTMTATRNGVATNYNEVTARLVWFSDANGSVPNYADVYEIFALRTAPPFQTFGGRLVGQDILHGPFMQVIINNLGADSCDVNYELIGSTRQIPGPYYREIDQGLPPNTRTPDNLIIDPDNGGVVGAAAGSDTFFPGLMRYGRCSWRITTSQNFTADFFAGDITTQFFSQGPLGTGVYVGELILPKRPLLLRVHNNAGVANNIFVNAISQMDKV